MSRGDALESWRLVYTGQRSTQGQLSMCAFKPPTGSTTLSVYYHGVKSTIYLLGRAEQMVYFN